MPPSEGPRVARGDNRARASREILMPRNLAPLRIATNAQAIKEDEGLAWESEQVFQVTKPDLNTWTGGTWTDDRVFFSWVVGT